MQAREIAVLMDTVRLVEYTRICMMRFFFLQLSVIVFVTMNKIFRVCKRLNAFIFYFRDMRTEVCGKQGIARFCIWQMEKIKCIKTEKNNKNRKCVGCVIICSKFLIDSAHAWFITINFLILDFPYKRSIYNQNEKNVRLKKIAASSIRAIDLDEGIQCGTSV